MAALQLSGIKPRETLSEKSSPKALREALRHIFSKSPVGVWLVGGTALSGYYAEHRRSDDLDLFALDETAHRTVRLAVRSLVKKGAVLSGERSSPYFYHTDCQMGGHSFTVDVVLDENLHRVGHAFKTKDGVLVADLPTLFATKVATLVSRCSEKDLFDLAWIFDQTQEIDVRQMIFVGQEIDGGLTTETLLIGLKGAILRREACHFLLSKSKTTVEQAYQKVEALRERLIRSLLQYEASLPPSDEANALSQSVTDQKRYHKRPRRE